jgi:hypothetical protein
MSTLSSKGPFWWDRELDSTGKPIRMDVRAAAGEIWEKACQQTRALLGEPCESGGLMERSVTQISRYLDRRAVTLSPENTGRLLMFAFRRGLRRHAAKLRRLQLGGDINEASTSPSVRSCTSKEDCRLDAEKAARYLCKRARKMYELRNAGFEWKEIAEMLNTTDAAARAEFSRELKRAKHKLKRERASLKKGSSPAN